MTRKVNIRDHSQQITQNENCQPRELTPHINLLSATSCSLPPLPFAQTHVHSFLAPPCANSPCYLHRRIRVSASLFRASLAAWQFSESPPRQMAFLFNRSNRPKTPQDLVRSVRESISRLDVPSEKKRAVEEITKCLNAMKTILIGDGGIPQNTPFFLSPFPPVCTELRLPYRFL